MKKSIDPTFAIMLAQLHDSSHEISDTIPKNNYTLTNVIKSFFGSISNASRIIEKSIEYSNFLDEMPKRVEYYHKVFARLYRIAKPIAMSGWAIPMSLYPEDHAYLAHHAKNDGSQYEYAINSLFNTYPERLETIISKCLSYTKDLPCHDLLQQSIDSYHEERWAISCAGMFCVLESIWSKTQKRGIANIRSKIDKFDDQYADLNAKKDMKRAFTALSMASTIYCIDRLFVKGRSYVGYTARNRLLHGNDIEHVSMIDCIRILVCISNMSVLVKATHTMDSEMLDKRSS